MERKPRVSIGLPVYNGERHVKQAIESCLAQTFDDFELIIVDNASTDSTWEICQEYARRDSRVSLCRNDKNVGGYRNFSRSLDLAQGKYFLWLAHDDLLEVSYLERCHAFLTSHPDFFGCYAYVTVISEDSTELYCLWPLVGLEAASPVVRFEVCLKASWRIIHGVYGMFRKDLLSAIQFADKPCLWPDRRLILKVALQGKVRLIREPLRRSRVRAGQGSDGTKPLREFWSGLFGYDARIPYFPWTRLIVVVSRDILRAEFGFFKKVRLVLFLLIRKESLHFISRDIVHNLALWTIDKPKLNHAFKKVWYWIQDRY